MLKKIIKKLEAVQNDDAPYAIGVRYALDVINRAYAETEGFSVLFSAFWKAYPNKKAKPAALKAWKKIDDKLGIEEELFIKIMNALEAVKKTPQWTKDDGQFIPHPSTWLNQMRWEDELKVEKTSENQSKFGHL